MPRVGSYAYPLFRLNSLLRETKVLHEKFGTKEFTREHVAQVLGQKITSGGLSQKLADLKSYGLISNTSGRFTITDIGIKTTFPGTESERADYLDKSVRNISLWRAIYEKCGKDPLADTFYLELAEITGITRPESQTVAENVRKSYIDDAKYLLSVKTPVKEPEPEKPSSGDVLEPARGRKPNMNATQTEPIFPNMNTDGSFPTLYDPELGATIVIDTPRKYQVAKIFWEAIAAKWERSNGSEKEPNEQGQTPPSES